MIEKFETATKKEIENELKETEKEFNTKRTDLQDITEEFKSLVSSIQNKMKELSDRYETLKKELEKRETENKD